MEDHEQRYRAHLERLASEVHQRSGRDIGQLLVQCLLPAMMKDAATYLGRGGVATHYVSGELDHVADWLASAVAADLKWLRNVDGNGVPRKFSKLATVSDVKAEANRGLDRMLRNTVSKAAVAGEEETVAVFDNGYTLVSLRTSAALDRESKEMQHCVGLGGYDEGVAAGSLAILSLRDQKGKAHVTMELRVDERMVVQIKGKQNRFPMQRYFDILVPWITAQGYEVSEQELAGGYFRQGGGPIRHVSTLSGGEELEGDLTLRFDGDGDIDLVLPPGLRIAGSLSVRAEYAPGKRVVFGSDTVVGNQVETTGATVVGLENVTSAHLRVIAGEIAPVPDGSRISGETYLSKVAMGDLLDRAVFEHGVEIVDVERVTVPAAASVRGDLKISGANFVRVNPGLSLTGGISVVGGVNDCMLTVGRNVSVCGSFHISNCDATLSEGLRVGEDLAVQFATMETLPSMMELGGLRLNKVRGIASIPSSAVINGNVYLGDTDVTSLGGRAEWPGDLRIPKAKIRHLPYGLTVTGSLEVSWTPLVEFPDAMRIGGSLTAVGCSAGRIPDDAVIGGSIDLSRNEAASIPDGMVISGCLKLDGAYLKRMPTGVKVEEIIHLGQFPVDRITRSFEAQSYSLSDSFVIDLSDLLEVEGNVWIDAKDASKLPAGMRIGGRLIVKGDHPDARLPEGIAVGEYVRGDDFEALERMIPKSANVGGMRVL
ncbi:PcfJ domain-containing protein [Pararhizobium sp. BT-229]|uniref:PcfJ domain-containing protein n=1 Tax=Pararhizobium sp. BT-229 TaxID=2986923 RepID=UPI0021F6D419|nr:PcfJ domain-containing protein [Pararhizobium sp. BT-229]MCV9964456.1 PcfJ domain-containing protein [Pararhizobium sp. BT-229]